MHSEPHIFFDMDGVLVIYEPSAWTGIQPPGLCQGSHYFLTCRPDPFALQLFQHVRSLYPSSTYILTTLHPSDELSKEQQQDKLDWLHHYLPDLSSRQIIFCQTSKSSAASEHLHRPLCASDLLIDDYSVNLDEWKAGKGTAVKYLNTINSPTCLYPCMDPAEGIHICLNTLLSLIPSQQKGTSYEIIH